jgi:hypothetical protein
MPGVHTYTLWTTVIPNANTDGKPLLISCDGSFETVHFETKPLELDSNAGVIIRRAELKTRWELFRIHGKRESSLLGNGVTKTLRGTSGCL